MLFQFGSDVTFLGEPSTKLDYELAYEENKIGNRGLPTESIQSTQRRGNLLAISNLASLLKQQGDVITQSRKEIMRTLS